ncbi:hypothetical protein [Devosia sp.]|uniref:hypothetical protein n=1 Tax=Devosia sp. TaxID=1871048 RepID=UPI0035B30111
MLKLIQIAALATLATVSVAGSASALTIKYIPGFVLNLGNGGTSSTVGEEFNPFVAEIDPRAACLEAGGQPIREITEDGSIGYRCYVPAQ